MSCPFSFCRPLQLALVLATLCPLALRAQAPSGALIDQIIANVRASEDLYDNLEIKIKSTYQLSPEHPARLDPKSVPPTLEKSETIQRCVLQGNCFLAEYSQKGVSLTAEPERHEAITGYDGDKTRRLFGATGNIHHGRFTPSEFYRPHTWIFAASPGLATHPLSLVLKGGATFRSQARVNVERDWETSFVKDEVVDGLRCLKIRCDCWVFQEGKRIELLSYSFLWLAPERNYLPIKRQGFVPPYSKSPEAPVSVGRAQDFREIRPALWLPFRQEVVVYDHAESTPEKMVVSNTEVIEVEEVKLYPNYPISFFRDISFPDGVVVHEVSGGNIIRSYVQGKEEDQGVAEAPANPWVWFILGNVLAVILLGALFVYLRLRKKRQAEKTSSTP